MMFGREINLLLMTSPGVFPIQAFCLVKYAECVQHMLSKLFAYVREAKKPEVAQATVKKSGGVEVSGNSEVSSGQVRREN